MKFEFNSPDILCGICPEVKTLLENFTSHSFHKINANIIYGMTIFPHFKKILLLNYLSIIRVTTDNLPINGYNTLSFFDAALVLYHLKSDE